MSSVGGVGGIDNTQPYANFSQKPGLSIDTIKSSDKATIVPPKQESQPTQGVFRRIQETFVSPFRENFELIHNVWSAVGTEKHLGCKIAKGAAAVFGTILCTVRFIVQCVSLVIPTLGVLIGGVVGGIVGHTIGGIIGGSLGFIGGLGWTVANLAVSAVLNGLTALFFSAAAGEKGTSREIFARLNEQSNQMVWASLWPMTAALAAVFSSG